MRTLGIILLLITGTWSYLIGWDRMSTPALTLIELETTLGFSPVSPAGILGILLLAGSFWPSPAPAPRAPKPTPPSAPNASLHLASLPLEPGAHVEQSRHEGEGFSILVVTRSPPERVRRATEQFFQALAMIQPPPRRARVRLVGCPSTGVPWHVMILGIARRQLTTEAGFSVAVTQLDGGDPEVEVRITRS